MQEQELEGKNIPKILWPFIIKHKKMVLIKKKNQIETISEKKTQVLIRINDNIIYMDKSLNKAKEKEEMIKNTITKLRVNSITINKIIYINKKYDYEEEDISNWKHFTKVLGIVPYVDEIYEEYRNIYNIGKTKVLNISELKKISKNSVIQISTEELTIKNVKILGKIIKEKKIKCYLHSSCCINLSNNENFIKRELEIKRHLIEGSMINCLGLILHVGKSKELNEKKGLKIMGKNIKKLLKTAKENCPLILETPAGQKTELLSKRENFRDFYLKYSQSSQNNFKICIDSAHVFAAGYMPSSYLNKMIVDIGPDNISLFHLNDSRIKKGGRVDRHQPVGYGFIGLTEIEKVIKICDTNNINMVEEW